MFDYKRSIDLLKGALLNPDATWNAYLPEAGDWKKTATLITGPAILISGFGAYLVGSIFPSLLLGAPGFGQMLVGLIVAAIAIAIIAVIVALVAGQLQGRNSFAHGLAATTLAFVPAYFGRILGPLPWVGWLLMLLLSLYSLVLLRRVLPTYLEVPEATRTKHYVISLIAAVVAFCVMGAMFSGGALRSNRGLLGMAHTESQVAETTSGLLSGVERGGRIVEQAEADRYTPPADGKLTGKQVERFVSVLEKTERYRADQEGRLKKLADKAEQRPLSAIGDLVSGVSGVVSLGTAEMEVVKTGDGNWAEHQWIKEQLQVARLQQDTNDTIRHNYELYQRHADKLDELAVW